jgi:hypothetical protein
MRSHRATHPPDAHDRGAVLSPRQVMRNRSGKRRSVPACRDERLRSARRCAADGPKDHDRAGCTLSIADESLGQPLDVNRAKGMVRPEAVPPFRRAGRIGKCHLDCWQSQGRASHSYGHRSDTFVAIQNRILRRRGVLCPRPQTGLGVSLCTNRIFVRGHSIYVQMIMIASPRSPRALLRAPPTMSRRV